MTKFFLFLLSITPFLITSKVLFLKDPPVWPDEAIFFDIARRLSSGGIPATDIFGGSIEGMEKISLWTPPLYYYLLAFWTNTFGSTIESTRSLSLTLAVISLAILFFVTFKIMNNMYYASLTTFLVSVDFSFTRAARLGRMDMLNLCLSIASLGIFLLFKKPQSLIFSGMFSSLAVLTHPLGFMPLITVILYILTSSESFKVKLKETIIFISPTFIFSAIWLASIYQHLNLLFVQYGLQMLRKSQEIPYVWTLFRTDFWWWLLLITNLIVYVLLLIQFKKNRKDTDRFVLIGLTVFALALIWGKEMWYLVYFQPFISLTFVSLLKVGIFKPIHIIGILLIVIVINLNFTLQTMNNFTGSDRFNYYEFTSQIASKTSPQSRLYLGTIPDPYFGLKMQGFTDLYEFSPVPLSNQDCKKLLSSMDYLVLNTITEFNGCPGIVEYLSKNTDNMEVITQQNGYRVYIIKLMEKEKRR